MGISTYQRCVKIMEEIRSRGYETQIAWPDLVGIIRTYAGSDKQTLKTYRRELQAFGFLSSENGLVFNIVRKPKVD